MLYNYFRTRARVADPLAYPFAAGALVYAQLDSFVTRKGNGFAFLIRNPHSFPPNPSSSEPPRRRRGAAALSRSGAAAWRATPAPPLSSSWRAAPPPPPPLGGRHRSSCLLSFCKGLGTLQRSSCLLSSCKGLGGCKGLGHVHDLRKRRK